VPSAIIIGMANSRARARDRPQSPRGLLRGGPRTLKATMSSTQTLSASLRLLKQEPRELSHMLTCSIASNGSSPACAVKPLVTDAVYRFAASRATILFSSSPEKSHFGRNGGGDPRRNWLGCRHFVSGCGVSP
jgi:hypothetical protein